MYSSFSSWDDFDRWYLSLLRGRDRVPAEALDEMNRIIAGTNLPHEKLERIRAWIAGRTRYVSIATGISGYQPRPAGETWRTAYGDCKDIALLLAALLRHAASRRTWYWCPPQATERLMNRFAFPGFFNHALCRVMSGGQAVYIDGTAPLAA